MPISLTHEGATVLYRYKDLTGCKINHVEDILQNNCEWFSSPVDFSDPLDCVVAYEAGMSRQEIVLAKTAFLARKADSLSAALTQAEQDIPLLASELERWEKQHIKGNVRRVENTGILCFTHRCDNLPMWTHYAKSHTGICIQYRVRSENDDPCLTFIAEAWPVEYSDRCPLINFMQDEKEEILRKVFLTKTLPYRYEEEYRILRYDQGRGLKPIPKGIIGAVVLGVNIESENRERIIRACAAYDGEIEIVNATLNRQTYGLQFDLERTV